MNVLLLLSVIRMKALVGDSRISCELCSPAENVSLDSTVSSLCI